MPPDAPAAPTTTPSGSSAGSSSPGAGVAMQQQAAAAVTELGPKTAEWLRDLYLMVGLGLGLIFIGQRLVRALS
jgi:hypothetical protein